MADLALITVTYTYPIFVDEFDDDLPIPIRNHYFSGETFDSSGISVIAFYNDGLSKPVFNYALEPVTPDMVNDSENDISRTITVSYAENSITVINTFSIIIRPIFLEYLEISRLPLKTDYIAVDAFNHFGLEVTGYYNDGSEWRITDYSLSTPDMNIVGTQTITVTYEGKTADFTITVESIKVISLIIIQPPSKLNYYIGEEFSSAGLEITGYYNNGTSTMITNYSLSAPNIGILGEQQITVSYENITTSFKIIIREIPTPLAINREYWQHFRFQMSDQNVTLNLKWVERMYMIDFIFREKTVNIATIRDTNKTYDIDSIFFNGATEDLRQLRLPHYTYSKVLRNGFEVPDQNKVEFKLMLENDALQIKEEECFCKFGNNASMINFPLDDRYKISGQDIVSIDYVNKRINVIVPKYSVKTFLDIRYFPGVWVCQDIDFNTGGSVFLDKGRYSFWVRAANGGQGGYITGIAADKGAWRNAGWESGRGSHFSLILDNPMNLNYKLGSTGKDGTGRFSDCEDGSAKGGGGGGGGGTTILTFSEDVNFGLGYRKEFCWKGGRGGDGEYVAEGNYEFGGDGGLGGTAETGSGEDGYPGSDDGKKGKKNNFAGLVGGIGGIGFSSKTRITLNGSTSSPTGRFTGDGFLFIKYDGE